VVATGGSGALAPLVGVAKALQDSGTEVSVYSVCPGSALFGFPLGGGMPPDEVAELTASPRAVKASSICAQGRPDKGIYLACDRVLDRPVAVDVFSDNSIMPNGMTVGAGKHRSWGSWMSTRTSRPRRITGKRAKRL